MSDIISRQDAVREIANHLGIPAENWMKIAEEWLRDVPSAQPEIIYCGECKYMMPNGRCSAFADPSIRPSASDYCSCAERRQE